MLFQLLANGFVNGCLYAIMAVGFALIYNTTKILHVAHGAIYSAAAYTCYVSLVRLAWPTSVAAATGILAAVILGVLTEFIVYAPLERRKSSLLVALLSSLGVYVVLVSLIALLFGNETKILRPGIEQPYLFGSITLTRIQLAQVIAAAIALPALLIILKRTTLGILIRAVRDNPTLASVMGINRSAIRIIVFSVGSAFAGLAATLAALDIGTDPYVGLPALLLAMVALIVGGVGTFEGPVLGGFLLGVLQSLVVWKTSARWTEAIVFAALLFFLFFRPQGIISVHRRVEEPL